ncbi:MAG: hypothetical protein KY462_02795 [Actinobacteria bacterium]|nr:hypothetical protein [Actinomycetota bacterium]
MSAIGLGIPPIGSVQCLPSYRCGPGCNPHQGPARAAVAAEHFPITVVNGEPGFINLLDALTSWQLAREITAATTMVASTSFKHVNPAGAAIVSLLDATDRAAAVARGVFGLGVGALPRSLP